MLPTPAIRRSLIAVFAFLGLAAAGLAQSGGYYGYGGPPAPAYGPGYGAPMYPPMHPGGRMGYPPRGGYGRPPAMGHTGPAPAEQPSGQPSGETGGDSTDVSIQGMRFVPATVRIQAGETVTWEQRDRMPHVVKSADAEGFTSERLTAGDSFSHTFEEAGTYDYYCSLHPSMRGTVVVE